MDQHKKKEIEKLTPIAFESSGEAIDAAVQMKKALDEQAQLLKGLQATRLQLSKSLPSDALIPEEVLANALAAAELLAK